MTVPLLCPLFLFSYTRDGNSSSLIDLLLLSVDTNLVFVHHVLYIVSPLCNVCLVNPFGLSTRNSLFPLPLLARFVLFASLRNAPHSLLETSPTYTSFASDHTPRRPGSISRSNLGVTLPDLMVRFRKPQVGLLNP